LPHTGDERQKTSPMTCAVSGQQFITLAVGSTIVAFGLKQLEDNADAHENADRPRDRAGGQRLIKDRRAEHHRDRRLGQRHKQHFGRIHALQ
jgi:hypothetical protein